jgi:plasmid stabilization system protein ParE
MRILYELTPKALDDLDEIWLYIAEDDLRAADRVESAILAACRRLSRFPGLGKPQNELTPRPLRFWTIPRYPNYLIVYWPETRPLRIIGILHGNRDIESILPSRH